MPPGRYRNHMTIQALTEAENAYGDVAGTMAAVGKVWARIEPFGARERMEAQRVGSDATHHIWARYRSSGITPDRRLVFDGITYNIQTVTNVGVANKEMDIVCKEIVN